jgi:hypothetical protein
MTVGMLPPHTNTMQMSASMPMRVGPPDADRLRLPPQPVKEPEPAERDGRCRLPGSGYAGKGQFERLRGAVCCCMMSLAKNALASKFLRLHTANRQETVYTYSKPHTYCMKKQCLLQAPGADCVQAATTRQPALHHRHQAEITLRA